MTIDEYLNQPRKLKNKSEQLYNRLLKAESKLDPRDPLNLGDGIPGRTYGNGHETRLLSYVDAVNEYKKTSQLYTETRDNLSRAIDNLLYWQGCLISRVYIYNVTFDIDDLNGAEEILHTNDRRQILAKLSESKAALADILRAQGVPIEN